MKSLLKVLLIVSLVILTNPHMLLGQNTFPSSGSVGIGTLSPGENLEIEASNASFGVGSTGNVPSTINLKNAKGFWHISGPRSNENYNKLSIFWYNGSNFNRYFTIQDNGKIGIGVATPTKKLTVNGTIRAEEVIVVENVGADFVFDEEYKLPDLNQVEAYIKRHKHLPEIPSAKEMKENGIKMGALQMKLLQKIEELMLYTIHQQTQINNLIQQLKSQGLLIDKLQKHLKNEEINEKS